MPFVKVDVAILDSSVWSPRDLRSLFLTALFMARPYTVEEPTPQINVRSLEPMGWIVPPGNYGLVEAAGTRIVERDGQDLEAGLTMLEQLGEPDEDSKNPAFDGRRVVRIAGGYLVLNYFDYRNRDYTAAARQQRRRDKLRAQPSCVTPPSRSHTVTTRDVTHADADADAEKRLPLAVEGSAAKESTDLSTSPPIAPPFRLARMLNRGLADNPQIGDTYNPVVATSGHALEAVEQLKAAGVPIEFAESWIYTLAVAYKPRKVGDQINAVTYLVPAVIEKWDAHRARIDAEAASVPAGAGSDVPAQNLSRNGTGDAKGRAMLIFGRLRSAVREVIVQNDPTDPGAGNRLEKHIDGTTLKSLDTAATRALAAIGGERAICRSDPAKDDALSWRFAAAYQAAANGARDK